jgi:hypothetical protein
VKLKLKRQRGKNEIIVMINIVKERWKVKTVLGDYKKRNDEDR